MQQVAQGKVARSKAGRDKGRFMVVLRVEGDFAYVADGKLRKLEKPKRKRLKHLAATARSVKLSDLSSDRELRRLLVHFNQDPLGCECDTGGNSLVKE